MGENRGQVLVVEDDAALATRVRQLLSGKGWEVVCTLDGQEALVKIRSNPPQLIVLDAVLPGLSGFHIARLIKFDPKSAKIPILMLTVLNQPQDKARGKEVGVDLYLTKPFVDEELVNSVRRLIGPQGA